MKKIVIIHGGDIFENRENFLKFVEEIEYIPNKKDGWKKNLAEQLGEGYEVFQPIMPNKWNADYDAWKIYFEKVIPFMDDGVILIGHSTGGLFLAKYLSENTLPKKISSLHLVAAVFDGSEEEYLGNFELQSNFSKLNGQCKNVYVYHSADDTMVPFSDSEKYMREISNAKHIVLQDRGHIQQPEFPELIENL